METNTQQQHHSIWTGVIELTKMAQYRSTDPLTWAVQLSSTLSSAGVSLPSIEVAKIIVDYICWENNVPITWKFLEMALTMKILPPMLILALLSVRVISCRKSQPAAYRIFLELLKRHAFSLSSQVNGQHYHKIMESVDDVLHLSKSFNLEPSDPGILVVEFVFSIVWQLVDASLDDESLLELVPRKSFKWPIKSHDMDIDNHNSFDEKTAKCHEGLHKMNTLLAMEVIGDLFVSWESFVEGLQILAVNSSALRNSKNITADTLLILTSDAHSVFSRDSNGSSYQQFRALMASGSLLSSSAQCLGARHSALWLPIDIFLEDTMDGSQVVARSATETLIGLVKALKAVNQTTWQDAFLGLWVAALRLVQRERDPSEGPVPRLDTCLCLLLSITPLAIVNIIEEEEIFLMDEAEYCSANQKNGKKVSAELRNDLVSSVQQLGDYEGLLTPPGSVSSVANQAATKAMMFLSGLSVGSGYLDGITLSDKPVNCAGNMRHLIVEACIARNLLDTSAYTWPGYVKGHSNQIPRSVTGQMPGWLSLMKGSTLTPALISALVKTPASSLAELEKVYEIAINGTGEEKISAAKVLCGASLTRGWNIQEHTVVFITRLLSPPVPAESSGESYLIGCAPYLNVIFLGVTTIDCVQIFSIHGLVPELAGALMPLCEFFGSCSPSISWTLKSGEELTSHAIFSNAFTLLLKLWRFYQPPFEQVLAGKSVIGTRLTPEDLLHVCNSRLASVGNSRQEPTKRLSRLSSMPSTEPIFMDSFPKLKLWYRQHQACMASPLSSLVPRTPVYQIFDGLLNMMFRKVNKGGQSLISASSESSNLSGSAVEDISLRVKVPAWDILEAVPYVLDAALTACAHGKLSPRELATGLKDLADFLPASLAAIVSYFSAEVTRGVWKPASMNGTDWPSPAANLAMIEQHIHKILADTGVDVPSLGAVGSAPATLALPLAALVSLTITYKLDKETDGYLNLVGPALNTLAAGCPWPCMPIISSLWAQKVKRWSDFLVFSASNNVFQHDSQAVVQLLRVCFRSTLGLNSSPIINGGGVGALLGHGFGSHISGGLAPVAPGILYLRVHRSVKNVMFMSKEIVTLLMDSVKEIATSGLSTEKLEKQKKAKYGMRYNQVSLAAAMTRVKLAASLGSSIVWITGGANFVHSLIKEYLPTWFISVHESAYEKGELGGILAMLRGYALAYFSMLSGTFALGIGSATTVPKRRPHVLGKHLAFLASALDGKISLGCCAATWRAYVTGFVSLIVGCAPAWMLDVDIHVLKSLSKGLRKWGEEELDLALLGVSGSRAMGAAAELIIENGV
ncbi:mediator of RNA polymerase II transcription subunit 33A-like isoform X2 [Apium graveolens]|uniref:mediator of RNA polymerase II transcription subunit 33A-like isoform X2 n=1 Tax=Apium graveolens TaxID=4045 RepID=UPI003D7AE38B